jgi:hypothetical protein
MIPLPLACVDFEHRGFAMFRGALDAKTVEELRQIVLRLQSSDIAKSRQVLYTHGAPPPGRPPLTALIDQWLSPHRHSGPTSTRGTAERLRPLAESLLGGAVVLFQDLVLVKRPGQGDFCWHQDYGFWPVDRPDGVVLWTALTSTGPRQAALRFAVGSHLQGVRPVVDLHTGEPQAAGAEREVIEGRYEIVEPTYAPGDVVAFSPLTFHASRPVTGPGERAAWASIFLSARCRWSHGHAPNHPLCRVVVDGAPVHDFDAVGGAP